MNFRNNQPLGERTYWIKNVQNNGPSDQRAFRITNLWSKRISNTPVLTRMCQKVAEKSRIIIAWIYYEVHGNRCHKLKSSVWYSCLLRRDIFNHYKKIRQNATEINNDRCSCMTGMHVHELEGHYKQCHELHTDYGLVTSVQMDIYSAF